MKIIVIGGKGTAVNIAEQIVDAHRSYGAKAEFLGYAFDDPAFGENINGHPILCKTRDLNAMYSHYSDIGFLYALYNPDKMRERVQLLKSYDIPREKFCNFIHPNSYISKSCKMGFGNVVLSHSSVQANVTLGDFNIINSNVVVEHDTNLESNNFIAASTCLGSFINVANGVFIGLNSTVRERVRIEDYAFVGMGSNVLNDIDAERIVFGNPAKEYKRSLK
ncbi:sialic acid O-acetyltransferase [Paenibacillus sp. JZ16]|uniref:sialic acid O-acetyltransferase n=1 Tax=Paenibacillus sp. JZ16 TaxID=1906272 RepID=UPI00188BC531|nr:sialic acid O-acetyltransferase [Paenibacillus sp. JZ16]